MATAERDNKSAWGFVAFPMAVLFVFILLPTVLGLALSLFQWSGGALWTPEGGWALPRWVGLTNFERLLEDERIGHGLVNTFVFVIGSVPASVLLAFVLAVAVNAEWFRGRTIARTLLFMPTIVSIVAIGFVWRWVLNDGAGLFNWGLSLVGIDDPPRWLSEGYWPLVWITIVQVWRQIGFCLVLYMAALQGVPTSVYEAASIDGAGPWRQVRSITWPMVRPMTVFLLVTGAIGGLQVFDLVFIMTGQSETLYTTVLNLQVYDQFVLGSYGYAAAIGVLIFAITIAVTAIQMWAFRGEGRR